MSTPDKSERESRGLPVMAIFGGRNLTAELVSDRVIEPIGRQVELRISSDVLVDDAPELLQPLRVLEGSGKGIFAGYVTTLEPRSEGWWTLLAHDMAVLDEVRQGGLGIRNSHPGEVIWAGARDSGMPPSRIRIEGWPRPREPFLVVVPVEGMELTHDLAAGEIALTSMRRVVEPFEGLGPAALQGAFLEPGAWLAMTVVADSLWDAERAAVQHFEDVLGRLTLAARYSFARSPGGEIRSFDRRRHRDHPRLRPIAGARGRSGRVWLRGYATSASGPINSDVLEDFGAVLGAPGATIKEAIAAWRRAAREKDPSVAAVALSEALEFYAAGTAVPPLLSPAQLKAAARAAALALKPSLTTDVRERLVQRIGQVNEPPAAVLLRAAIERDRVPIADDEFELLRRIREVRRKVLHGKERDSLADDDFRLGCALVNRLLMFRLHRIRSANAGRHDVARPSGNTA